MSEVIKMTVINASWEDTYNDGDWHCSNCGAIVEKYEQINHNWYYCYHCGAKMSKPYIEESASKNDNS